jgi:hypothetical protein
MKVHVTDSACIGELIHDLLRAGCVPARLDAETLVVVYPDAHDAKQARTELEFFLRAWQVGHPQVGVTLISS